MEGDAHKFVRSEVTDVKKQLECIGRQVCCLETILEFRSNREVHIENCRKILEYNDIRIVVRTTELQLEFWGRNLIAESRSPDYLVISGELQSVCFAKKPWKTRETYGTSAR